MGASSGESGELTAVSTVLERGVVLDWDRWPSLLASVLFAGTNGFTGKEKLVWQDCEVDPASLTENDRKELNVSEMLPASVEEALQALEDDQELVDLLSPELVEKYSSVKHFELKFLGSMEDEEKRQFLIARY